MNHQPMKLALSVRVTNTQDGTVLDRIFDRFPVRIGRSGLNDLVLDFGFVSNFHAAIERNDQMTTSMVPRSGVDTSRQC